MNDADELTKVLSDTRELWCWKDKGNTIVSIPQVVLAITSSDWGQRLQAQREVLELVRGYFDGRTAAGRAIRAALGKEIHDAV